jgi:uncharacterized phiE125 gp8 family phage protein
MPKALITPPAATPVTLAEVKAHLRVETADEDDYLSDLMATAIAHVEQATGRALITQTWRLYFDAWPPETGNDLLVELSVSPVRAIDEIRVYDSEGTPETLTSDNWTLDAVSEPARLLLSDAVSPEQELNGIEIDVEAGFGDTGADVPDTLRRAILVLCAHWHELRGSASDASIEASEPPGFARLIAPFSRVRL